MTGHKIRAERPDLPEVFKGLNQQAAAKPANISREVAPRSRRDGETYS